MSSGLMTVKSQQPLDESAIHRMLYQVYGVSAARPS
jgi:hypothetical protein